MGENICIWNDRQGNDLQDIQIVHVAHYLKKKSNKKNR